MLILHNLTEQMLIASMCCAECYNRAKDAQMREAFPFSSEFTI